MKIKKQIKNKPKTLSPWEWTLIVAAWRYYENRMTIASSMFPHEIIEHFFCGAYDEDSCNRIARQFSYIDHHNGESDWSGTKYLMDMDKTPWCKFYAFMKAWIDGFATVTVSDGKKTEVVEAFYCEFTKRWHPKQLYMAGGLHESAYIPPEYIKKIVGGNRNV